MEFVIPTQELNYLISKIQNVVPSRAAVPILTNLLVEGQDGELTVTATDLTVSMRCRTEAKILIPGAITLPAKRFSQLVHELTAVNLTVAAKEQLGIEISADSSNFKMQGMEKELFPILPDIEGLKQFKMRQGDLKEILFQTAFAAAKKDDRYTLTAVQMQLAAERVRFIATDGRRVACTFANVELPENLNEIVLVPIKAIEEIQKNLTEDEEEVTVSLAEDRIAIETADTLVISKLLAGEFPDISAIIPESCERVATLHREELMTLLRQIVLFAPNPYDSALFSFSDANLSLEASSSKVGEGKVSMPVNWQGEPLSVAFNPGYFIEILRHCKEEVVTIGLIDPYNPALLTDGVVNPFVAAEATPLFLLLPLRSDSIPT